jgi:hypothetical protein
MKNVHTALCWALFLAAVAFLGCSSRPEDPAKTVRFEAFFRDILADRVPDQNLSDQMNLALTPTRVSEICAFYTRLGKFQHLQFLGTDKVQGYDRYHYAAIFAGGKQAVMFVLDSQGKLSGFFNE